MSFGRKFFRWLAGSALMRALFNWLHRWDRYEVALAFDAADWFMNASATKPGFWNPPLLNDRQRAPSLPDEPESLRPPYCDTGSAARDGSSSQTNR